MNIVERSCVLQAYLRALHSDARTQEQAIFTAAEELCLPEEAVIDVVRDHGGEILR